MCENIREKMKEKLTAVNDIFKYFEKQIKSSFIIEDFKWRPILIHRSSVKISPYDGNSS